MLLSRAARRFKDSTSGMLVFRGLFQISQSCPRELFIRDQNYFISVIYSSRICRFYTVKNSSRLIFVGRMIVLSFHPPQHADHLPKANIGTQGVQELFSVMGAFVEMFTVTIWLRFSAKMYNKNELNWKFMMYTRCYIGNGKMTKSHMHNSLTDRSHSPSSPQERFLLKIRKLRDLFAFYTSRKFTLCTQHNRLYFAENRKKEEKNL